MDGKINLQKFVEQLDMMDMADEWSYFVNRATGEIVTLETRYLAMAEEDISPMSLLGMADQEQLQLAEAILEHWADMIRFPNRHEWDEYGMMEDFSEAYPDEHIRACLCIALSGRGAFRRFKDTLIRFGAEAQWYAYRDAHMLEFAQTWCEENQMSCDVEEV